MQTSKIIALAQRVKSDLEMLRTKSNGSIMFVDLVGSTEYKSRHLAEEDWLPRLATFLVSVTKIVETHGRVVKYIGDEVMAYFDEPNSALYAAQAAEQVVQFCHEFSELTFEVKIALDFGSVSMLDFSPQRRRKKETSLTWGDPNGLTVDRCARIMSKAIPGAILCSFEFREQSAAKNRWRFAGSFHPKGILKSVRTYQLKLDSATHVRVGDDKMTLSDCMRRLAAAERNLIATRAMRRPIPRRPR